jgi:hypothetical protein
MSSATASSCHGFPPTPSVRECASRCMVSRDSQHGTPDAPQCTGPHLAVVSALPVRRGVFQIRPAGPANTECGTQARELLTMCEGLASLPPSLVYASTVSGATVAAGCSPPFDLSPFSILCAGIWLLVTLVFDPSISRLIPFVGCPLLSVLLATSAFEPFTVP